MKPVCLITGSAGRLGTALLERLSPSCELVAAYHKRVPAFPSQVAERLMPFGQAVAPSCHAVQVDLRSNEDQRRLVEVAVARFGGLDVLINCAADIKFHGKLLDLAFHETAAREQMSLNCIEPLRLVSLLHHTVWKHDPATNHARNRCVVNVSSISGVKVFDSVGQAFYGASKAALNHLTRYLAGELAPYRVRANALCPARFTNSPTIEDVVDAIDDLIRGNMTGKVLEVDYAGRSENPARESLRAV